MFIVQLVNFLSQQDTGAGFKCKCQDGFTGRRCDTIAVSCKTSPCKNGGSCLETDGSYQCSCFPGYTGYNCEIQINECQSKPCLNGKLISIKLKYFRNLMARNYWILHLFIVIYSNFPKKIISDYWWDKTCYLSVPVD